MTSGSGPSQFPSDHQELINRNLDQIIHSSTYRLAHEDLELLNSSSMRGVRMLLEISKPELQLEEAGITSRLSFLVELVLRNNNLQKQILKKLLMT